MSLQYLDCSAEAPVTLLNLAIVISSLTNKVGAARSFTKNVDRSHLLQLLPRSQDELPPRTMKVCVVLVINILINTNVMYYNFFFYFMGSVKLAQFLLIALISNQILFFIVWFCSRLGKTDAIFIAKQPQIEAPWDVYMMFVDPEKLLTGFVGKWLLILINSAQGTSYGTYHSYGLVVT